LANIRILETGIDVSDILAQLKQYPEDWFNQRKIENTGSLLDRGYADIPVGNLQLVVGAVTKAEDFVGDSELCVPTDAFKRHTAVLHKLVQLGFRDISRCGFLSLEVGGFVGQHIDEGTYYLTRDRYHLSIQGSYDYTVGGETVRIEPGMLIWFNNKLMHGTQNVGDCTRITFVFDVKNPELVALQKEKMYNKSLGEVK
jgi:hypothetical protein